MHRYFAQVWCSVLCVVAAIHSLEYFIFHFYFLSVLSFFFSPFSPGSHQSCSYTELCPERPQQDNHLSTQGPRCNARIWEWKRGIFFHTLCKPTYSLAHTARQLHLWQYVWSLPGCRILFFPWTGHRRSICVVFKNLIHWTGVQVPWETSRVTDWVQEERFYRRGELVYLTSLR